MKFLSAKLYFLSAVLTATYCLPLRADTMSISGVPSYGWYHGCEPTSVGMIMGYWDLNGYPNLFDAQGSLVYTQSNVQDQISSPAHNAKYDPTPDIIDSILPVPSKTSIADFARTSVDPLEFGYSYVSTTGSASVAYANYRGYNFTYTNNFYSTTWSTLVSEVNAGKPVLFIVDANADGIFDHAVPAIGYDTNYNGDGDYYECYTTAGEGFAPVWYKFQYETAGQPYGVYGAIQLDPQPVPEPSTIILLLACAPLFLLYLRRRKN